ncbi:GTP cyclohydrolase [Ascidiimonas sp. W6]|uniref:GTP cyclohydrolase n=1 Tax=Ascidiimonas meishanensis TaxID=3128903 RepID=UPI0030EC5119
MIVSLAEGTLKTKYGTFKEVLFYDGQKEIIVLIMGSIKNESDVLCRVHSSCIFGHYFNSIECDCQEQMNSSQKLIQEAGKGLIILLDQEGKGNGHLALLNSVQYKRQGISQAEAYKLSGYKEDARDFSQAAKVLKYLKVRSIIMLTDNPEKTKTMNDHGVNVSGTLKTS